MMDIISSAILYYLHYFYLLNPKEYFHINDIHTYVYQEVLSQGHDYEVTQNDMTIALDNLLSIGFIQCDPPSYRLTPYGRAYIENPQPNYPQLSLDEQKRSNQITTTALYIAVISLCVAIASLYFTWYAYTH